jgi:hypothetical protein
MRPTVYISMIAATVALAPMAQSATSAQTRACVDAFVSNNLPDREVEVHVNDYVAPMPLRLFDEMALELQAVERSTGRTIAKATCRMESGEVTITEL